MADVELVIKIPEEDFEIMKHNIAVNNPLCPLSQGEMVTIIANGIPLPKGHGRLIDASQLLTITDCMEDGTERCYVPYVHIEEAETIIEAESEG